MNIRPANSGEADIEAIVHHRRSMFLEMGYAGDPSLDAMTTRFRPWLRQRMEAGEYLAWFALARDSSIAAGVGLWLMDWPPHVIGASPRRGNILNVYTEPTHRRAGLARALMQVVLEWCAANHIDVVILHASQEGRGLYESLGFVPTNEMRRLRL